MLLSCSLFLVGSRLLLVVVLVLIVLVVVILAVLSLVLVKLLVGHLGHLSDELDLLCVEIQQVALEVGGLCHYPLQLSLFSLQLCLYALDLSLSLLLELIEQTVYRRVVILPDLLQLLGVGLLESHLLSLCRLDEVSRLSLSLVDELVGVLLSVYHRRLDSFLVVAVLVDLLHQLPDLVLILGILRSQALYFICAIRQELINVCGIQTVLCSPEAFVPDLIGFKHRK